MRAFFKVALNDLVVKSGTNGRLGRFSVSEGREEGRRVRLRRDRFLNADRFDRYNLAAGGPIAHPEAKFC